MYPANPGGVAHFNRGKKHPIKRNEKRNLYRDRQATAKGIDFFFAVDLHQLHLHLLRVVFQTFAHFHDLGVDGFHLAHALIRLGVQPVKSYFQYNHQSHNRPAPVTDDPVEFIKQPVQGLGQNGQPAVVLDQLKTRVKRFEYFFFLRTNKQAGRLR